MTVNNELILPHDSDEWVNSKEIIKSCDLMLAEVSFPSTGLGIELGWANSFDIPIICLYRRGKDPSYSLNAVTDKLIIYKDKLDDSIISEVIKVI